MTRLAAPQADLVDRVLGRVGYEHRLVGYRVRRRAGAIPVHLYGFDEVVQLLADKYPRLDLAKLEEWLRSAIGDHELADRVAEVVGAETSDRDRMLRVRTLMSERLSQCDRRALA
jgi:hypothetical protein